MQTPSTSDLSDPLSGADALAPDRLTVDRLSAEVRESLLLLALSLLVTVGVAGAASALLTLLA